VLRFLSIRNLAVIESIEMTFEPGLNVLTGETGAGKSILVGAVGLLLGGRASAELVRTGEETATVEAEFTLGDRDVIVRREVTAQGRSRAFVDGSLATAATLRDLSGQLVDLHGQHEHQALLDPNTHVDLLDRFAGLQPRRAAVADAFTTLSTLRTEADRLRQAERDRAARLDFVDFQLEELDRAAVRPAEDEELQSLRERLSNADKIVQLCTEGYARLYESDEAVLAGLGQVWRRVGDLAALDPRFTPFVDGKASIKAHLEDLAQALRNYASEIDAAPTRLQEVEDRLAELGRLKRKHGPTLPDVIAKRDALSAERETLAGSVARLIEIDAAMGTSTEAYLAVARELSRERRAAAGRLETGIEEQLADLAMKRSRFEVRFTTGEAAAWGERGVDGVEFYVSPNPGEDVRPLARIVSGGELSRLMLAMKTLASTDSPGKTLIFDEVDAGIGGQVADVVGRKLRGLGDSFQVLCITHLPQIAAYGTSHYRIAKTVRGARTVTEIQHLTAEERVDELARMIAGDDVSATTRRSAREILVSKAVGGDERTTKGESERRKRK
jgi:DNA repair protein RecN (Recombination protein N)